MMVLLKCTGGGMSKRGWLNGVSVMSVVAADQEVNCKLWSETSGTETVKCAGQCPRPVTIP